MSETAERRTYATLGDALRGEGIPQENWETVQRIVDTVGIASYSAVLERGRRSRRGIFAARINSGPALHIESGHTTGFVTEAEARLAAPSREAWRNTDTGSRWGITHPRNSHRDGNGETQGESPRETCGQCFMEKSTNGSCLCW